MSFHYPDRKSLAIFPPLASNIVLSKNIVYFGLFALFTYFVLPLFFRRNLKDKDGHSLPPGPLLRYPFLRKYPEWTLHRWTQKYGSIFSVWMGSQLCVVLNDPKVARDLMVVHGANFSSRWNFFMKNVTILQWGGITAAKYGETWRKHRRIGNWILTPKAIQGYAHVLDYEAHQFLRGLYLGAEKGNVPVKPLPYAARYALNNMLAIAFGTRADSTNDPLVLRATSLAKEFMHLTGPWSNMIDFIPFLQKLPLFMNPRKAQGMRLRANFMETYGAMIQRVKTRMDAGENVPDCLVKNLLDAQETEDLTWADICFISNAFTTGGVYSTSGLLQWVLALLPSHPEVQAKAHEELDRVIGRSNMPTSDDEARLPYIRAIIKELLRVHSPFWNGTPHCSEEDFVYNGMFIPAKTTVVLNCYSLHHNEDRYPDSFQFKPERYLGDDLSSTESSKLADPFARDHWAFGAGRRICPGILVAERELFIAISRLLWCFTIHEVPGEPISLKEYEGNSGRTPMPFRVKIIPRHENVERLLELESELKF